MTWPHLSMYMHVATPLHVRGHTSTCAWPHLYMYVATPVHVRGHTSMCAHIDVASSLALAEAKADQLTCITHTSILGGYLAPRTHVHTYMH